MHFRNKFPKKKHIKILIECFRFVSNINFESRLIPYISKHCSLRILTGKKHHQIKLQCLQKVWIWAFESFVPLINLLKLSSYCENSVLCDRSILHSPFIGFWYGSFAWQIKEKNKEKMRKFWHLILFISLTSKKVSPSN